MAISNIDLRMGIDLSGPVRAVLFSNESFEVVSSMTAKTEFDQDSKEKLTALASEIKDFWQTHKVRPEGIAGLPIKNCFLFTVSLPLLGKKELKQAIRLQVERIVPGSSHNVRMAVQKWPSKLQLPPSSSPVVGNTTYAVAAAEADSVRAAEGLMKMAGVRPVAVEIPASPACRLGWWIWTDQMAAQHSDPAAESGLGAGESGNSAGENDSPEIRLNITLDVHPGEALLHLAFDSCPWLMREIPLNPDNLLANAQIIAGEVSRSERFVIGSWPGQFAVRVTVLGSSENTGFIADYLSEQVGIKNRVFGPRSIPCDSEYGAALGLVLPKEGVSLS